MSQQIRDGDWQRVADEIRAELARREWTQAQLADAAGVSTRAISDLCSGRPHGRMPSSVAPVERALEWQPGTIHRLLNGGDLRRKPSGQPTNIERQADPAKEAARLLRGQYPNDGWLVDDDPGVVQVAQAWATLGVFNQLVVISNRLGEIADHLQQIRRHGL